MGGGPRRRAARQGRRLHQHRLQRPRLPRPGGSHTLERFVNEVARDVKDPQTKVSVPERLRARRDRWAPAEDAKEVRDRRDLRIDALGSGSDYTPFLQHLGIASLEHRLRRRGRRRLVPLDLRLLRPLHALRRSRRSNTASRWPRSPAAPSCASPTPTSCPSIHAARGDASAATSREVQKLADDMRERDGGDEPPRAGADSTQLAADPAAALAAPQPAEPVPFINFAPLQNAVARAAARAPASTCLEGRARGGPLPLEADGARRRAHAAERRLTRAEGLPGAPGSPTRSTRRASTRATA